MSAEDVVRLIGSGESSRLEFKSSIRYDYQTQSVNKELVKVIAKTVAGFLNASGGRLLIGVSDDGTVLGIQRDVDTLSRKTHDAFELTLRNAIASHLGIAITPRLTIEHVRIDNETVTCITCPPNDSPVFFQDQGRQEFFVRDGNLTRPLDVRTTHEYIGVHRPPPPVISDEIVRQAFADSIREQVRPMLQELLGAAIDRRVPAPPQGQVDQVAQELAQLEPSLPLETVTQELTQLVPRAVSVGREMPVDWIRIASRTVLNLFLGPLAASPGWKRIFLISPWMSDIEQSADMTLAQFLKRIRDDGTTVYVVTRPPMEEWHSATLARLGETGRVNIALVPGLHVKLYCAQTTRGSFAMLGSANFTQLGLINREIGLLVTSYGEGQRLVKELTYEAANIYRLPERRLLYQASFRAK